MLLIAATRTFTVRLTVGNGELDQEYNRIKMCCVNLSDLHFDLYNSFYIQTDDI